jgi:hypothetical protein|tara:strand:- start:595 stop:1287 length:693 start_codon:yes stop_codon:yes gene_type:complete
MKNSYLGWELDDFNNANNFRNYQLDIFSKYIKGEVAEIGPGSDYNNIVDRYKGREVKSVNLYEPTANLFQTLKKKLKKKKIKIFNKIFISRKKYDTILYLDVLEHIKKDKAEIYKAISSLKKNGHLIINVPAYQFLYSNFDKSVGHCKRYNKKGLKNIFYNYKNIEIKMYYYDSVGFFLSFFSKFLKVSHKKNFNKKIFLWDSLIPASRLLDKLIFNLFGKSLICIVKKS